MILKNGTHFDYKSIILKVTGFIQAKAANTKFSLNIIEDSIYLLTLKSRKQAFVKAMTIV